MLGNTLGDVDRGKIGGDKGLCQVLSGGSFEGTMDGNLDGAGPGEVDPLSI